MKYRTFGRLGWPVSEVGYGMWAVGGGEGGWTGNDDEESLVSLRESIMLGCNFFDTAWIYGRGWSETLLGQLLREFPAKKLYIATKIPPLDRTWPSSRGSRIDDIYPDAHIREFTKRSLENLGIERIDLLQFHVWEDAWADDVRWQRTVADLKARGTIAAVGISINRWEPWNVLRTLGTGLIDVVQVAYNLFDQSPEDELIPTCRELGVGVIARVPFDEGALAGTLTVDSTWPSGDWRNSYFVPENLIPSVERAERLKRLVPEGDSLASIALRYVLENDGVSTVIPGMRKLQHVRANMSASGRPPLGPDLVARLKLQRWDREPTWWSQ